MCGFHCSGVLWNSNYHQSQKGSSATRNFKIKAVIVTGVGFFLMSLCLIWVVLFSFKEIEHESYLQCFRTTSPLHLLPIHCEEVSTSTEL